MTGPRMCRGHPEAVTKSQTLYHPSPVMLYPHHPKPNSSSRHPRHNTDTRHARLPRRRIRTANREHARAPRAAHGTLDAKARGATQAAAHARGGTSRIRRRARGATADRRRPADHHRDPTSARDAAAHALQGGGARRVVGAARGYSACACPGVGEGGDNVWEAEVGVGNEARGGGGRWAVGGRRGAGADVA